MLNRLREIFNFASKEESDQAHREDHAVLHRAFNEAARMPPAQTSSAANSANLKAALADSVYQGIGRTLIIPPEEYRLNDSLTLESVLGLRVVGYGGQTRLVSTLSNPSRDLFELADVRETVIRDIAVVVQNPISAVFGMRNRAGGRTAPSFNLFENIRIEGLDKILAGVHVGGGTDETDSVDANNDFHIFRRLYLTGYTSAGAVLRGYAGSAQSYGNQFENCLFYGGAGAQYGISAGGNYPGNFAWYGGFMHNHSISDFNIGRSYQAYIIHGGNSEGSARWITTDNQAYCTIEARGFRWAGNSAHADGKMMKLSGDVTATFANNVLGDGSGDRALTIELANLDAVSSIKFNNNRVFSSASAVFDTTAPHEMSGNSQFTNEANGTKKALTA